MNCDPKLEIVEPITFHKCLNPVDDVWRYIETRALLILRQQIVDVECALSELEVMSGV